MFSGQKYRLFSSLSFSNYKVIKKYIGVPDHEFTL